MSKYALLTTIAAAGLFSAVAAVGTVTLADDKGKSEEYSAVTLPLETVIAKLKHEGYDEIVEIERESGGYEAKVYNADGRRVELYIDGRSGEILGDEDKGYRDSDSRDDSSN